MLGKNSLHDPNLRVLYWLTSKFIGKWFFTFKNRINQRFLNHSTRIMYKMVGVLDIIIYTKNLSDRIIEIGLNSIKPSSLILASSLDKDVL